MSDHGPFPSIYLNRVYISKSQHSLQSVPKHKTECCKVSKLGITNESRLQKWHNEQENKISLSNLEKHYK